jgi:hypothetical protein
MAFGTRVAGVRSERMRINSAGDLKFGSASASASASVQAEFKRADASYTLQLTNDESGNGPGNNMRLVQGFNSYVQASNGLYLDPTGALGVTKGISFPASQVASADANTLDDYEEGTWTPTLQTDGNTSFTVTNALGKYTKIGNLVSFAMYLSWSAQSGSYGSVTITGYPFSIYWGANSVQRMFSFPIKASSAAIQGFQLKNDTNNYVNNSYLYNATDTSIVSAASIGGSGWFSVQGQYWTT